MSEETPDLGSLMRKLKEIEEQMKQQGERGGKNSDAKFMDTLAKGVSLEKLFEGADGRYKIPAYLVKEYSSTSHSDPERAVPVLSEDVVHVVGKLRDSARGFTRSQPGPMIYEAQILGTLEPLLAANRRVYDVFQQLFEIMTEAGILKGSAITASDALFDTIDKLVTWMERIVQGRVACMEGFANGGVAEMRIQWNARFGAYSGYTSVDAITASINKAKTESYVKELSKAAASSQVRKELRTDAPKGSGQVFNQGRGFGRGSSSKFTNPPTTQASFPKSQSDKP